jgi:hypothetical protein
MFEAEIPMPWDKYRQMHVASVCRMCYIIILHNWLYAFAYFSVGRNLTRRTEHYVNLAKHSPMELLELPNPVCIACLSVEDGVVWRPKQ